MSEVFPKDYLYTAHQGLFRAYRERSYRPVWRRLVIFCSPEWNETRELLLRAMMDEWVKEEAHSPILLALHIAVVVGPFWTRTQARRARLLNDALLAACPSTDGKCLRPHQVRHCLVQHRKIWRRAENDRNRNAHFAVLLRHATIYVTYRRRRKLNSIILELDLNKVENITKKQSEQNEEVLERRNHRLYRDKVGKR